MSEDVPRYGAQQEAPAETVYDPRLDTEPGAHPDDPRYKVETMNPMLLLADFERGRGFAVDWTQVARGADFWDQQDPKPSVAEPLQ